MFGILITSAVYTWHFVYLTVLFLSFFQFFFFVLVFSCMVVITGWMVRSLLREANDRVLRLWDGGEEKEEESRHPSGRQKRRRTDNLNSLVYIRWEVCDERIELSFFPLTHLELVEAMDGVGRGGGRGFVFSFSDVASDDPGGLAPPAPPADEG